MLRKLDRYLIRETVGPFLLSLAVFTFVLAVQPMLINAQTLLAKGVPLGTVAFLLLMLLPQALGITLPMGFLSGLLMAFGRLSGDRETVALLACGVNPLRMLRPALALGVVAGGLTLYVMIDLVPDCNQRFREITAQYLTQTAESDIKPQMFYEGFPQKVLIVRNTSPSGGWDGVFLADTTHPTAITVAMAEHGHLVLDKERLLVNIVLDKVVNYVPSDEPGVYTVSEAQRSTLQVDPKSVFGNGTLALNRGLAELTVAGLRTQLADKVAHGLSPHNEIMYIHQKFSFPVACLVFSLLAVALGFHTRKEGKLGGLTVGLAVIFLYYACMEIADAGAKSRTHWFSPYWARWFPNMVLGALGVVAVWWRARATGHSLSLNLPGWVAGRWRRWAASTASPGSAGTARKAPARIVLVVRVPRLALPRPRLLDLYISRQFLRMIGLSFFALMLLYYIGTIVDLSEKLFKGQASGWVLAQYMWYSTPRFIYYVIPFATLVAVLGTIGGLTKSSELTVMRACGISLYRAAMPLLVIGILSSSLLFFLEERVLAQSNKKADELEDTIRDRPHHTTNIENRNWLVGRNDRIYYYANFDSRGGEIHHLSVFEPMTKPYRLVNQVFVNVASCPDLTCQSGVWQADQGWQQRFTRAERPVRKSFARRSIALDPMKNFTLAQVDASMMTFNELRDYIARSRASGFNITEERVNLQSKIAFPAVTLVMTALAVPFAVSTGRRGALYGIGLAIILSVSYWLLTNFFLAAGRAGLLPPALAAWATNILFMSIASYLVFAVRT